MKYLLPDSVYKALKWLGLIALPALGLLYVTIAPLWGWPMPEAVQKTCDAVGIFIGTLIGISEATKKEADDA